MIKERQVKPIHEQVSHLLDDVLEATENTAVYVHTRRYRAKLLNYETGLLLRLRGAWRVLTGRSIAVHFKTDER